GSIGASVAPIASHCTTWPIMKDGKVEIRVEALTATGGSRNRGVVVARGSDTFWLRTDQPRTATLSSTAVGEKTDAFGKVERVRVFLTYQSCR
ncbi:MAG: hypothetical protein ACKOEO_19395, partial [Planctomycetaceae bacterium]